MGTRNRKSRNRNPRRGRPPRSLFLGRQLLRLKRDGMKYRDLTTILREMRGGALPEVDPSHPTWFQTPRRYVRDAEAWERLHEHGLRICDARQRGEISEREFRRRVTDWWPGFVRILLNMFKTHNDVLDGKVWLLDSKGRRLGQKQVLAWSVATLEGMAQMAATICSIGTYPSQPRDLEEIAQVVEEVKAIRARR